MTGVEAEEKDKSAEQLEKEFRQSIKDIAEGKVLRTEEDIREYLQHIRGSSGPDR